MLHFLTALHFHISTRLFYNLFICFVFDSLFCYQFVFECFVPNIRLLLKVAGLKPAILLKRRLRHRCFPLNFVKFLRTTFSQNTSGGCFCFHKSCSSDNIKRIESDDSSNNLVKGTGAGAVVHKYS